MNIQSFYDRIKARLLSGEWKSGQRLPSIRHLVAAEKVSYHTIVSAYDRLTAEGLIEAQQGRGYFVTRHPIGKYGEQRAALPLEIMSSDPLFKLLQSRPETIKLGCGWLPTAWRDTELLARGIRRTARLEQRSLVEYGDIHGYRPLRQQLSKHLKSKTRVEVQPMQIITTLGATQALDMAVRLTIKANDLVMVDDPGNGNLIKLIQLAGGNVVGVPRTQEGPDAGFIADFLQRNMVQVFFCNSTFHNPTGGNLSAKNAFEILRLAREHQFLIVEDDVYGDFTPDDHQTFAELDNLDSVLYIGSFSKSLSASLRVGYIACNSELVEPLIHLKLLTTVAVPSFCERFVNTILTDGSYLKHMRNIQRKLMAQQELTQLALKNHGWEFNVVPNGGMFLWVSHPELDDLSSFIKRLERHGVLLMPGSAFGVNKAYTNMTRINVSHFSSSQAPLFAI